MIYSFVFIFLLAQNPCSKINSSHPEYEMLQNKINAKIDNAANLSTIAGEADSVLSKLISAKSPVLMSWLKKRDLLVQKEEVIAQEWRKYYFKNYVLNSYPSDNAPINRSVENLFLEINDLAFSKKYKKRVESIFQQVKTDAKRLVVTWPLSDTQRQQITHRIDTIKLYWFSQLKGSRYEKMPLEFVSWGVAYDPPTNEINMGVQARQYQTEANLYAVLSHEVGHSIDSCRWGAFMKANSPFGPIESCLREEKSIAAKVRDDSKMKVSIEKGLLTKEMAQSLQQHPTCNRSFYPPEGTQKDQLPEVFADWFSVQVFASSSFSNEHPRPDLCNNKPLMTGSSYLSNLDRLTKIYFSHPKLAAKIGLQPKYPLCSFNTL